MSQPARAIFSFDAWDRDHPGERPPGDRLDAQFQELLRGQREIVARLDAILRSDGKLRAEILPFAPPAGRAGKSSPPAAPLPSTPALGPNAGGFYASDVDGADATAADYAQVAIAWAEHLPDPIPPDVLAINAITGDHWSARWWANRAANFLSGLLNGGAGIAAEQLTVAVQSVLPPLSSAPVDALSTMQIIVAGKVYSGCVTPRPFTVNGSVVTWAGPAIAPGTEVVARYRYAVAPVAAAKVPAISLYYVAAQGQTDFLLSTPDRFSLSYSLRAGSKVQVSRNGARLMPDDGTGKGSYRVSGNAVVLLYPAGLDETLVVDVWEPA